MQAAYSNSLKERRIGFRPNFRTYKPKAIYNSEKMGNPKEA